MPANDSSSGHLSPFEAIKHTDEDGEYWSARELARVLGYTQWRNFHYAIEKATEACKNSGYEPSDHFAETSKRIEAGKGAQREIKDYHLSRYACYLIVQNADPTKEIVALGQTYFAVQTRRAEQADLLAGMTEDQRRLFLRDQVAEHNVQLAASASGAGIITQRDFAVFQDHGYMGLYGGERAKDIHARKGLKRSQHILDHMGSTELAANLFRATQTDEKIRREAIDTKEEANAAHHQIGQAVREAIIGMGGTPPEQLPTPGKSIHLVRREEARRLTIEAEDRLGLFAPLAQPQQRDPADREDDADEEEDGSATGEA